MEALFPLFDRNWAADPPIRFRRLLIQLLLWTADCYFPALMDAMFRTCSVMPETRAVFALMESVWVSKAGPI